MNEVVEKYIESLRACSYPEEYIQQEIERILKKLNKYSEDKSKSEYYYAKGDLVKKVKVDKDLWLKTLKLYIYYTNISKMSRGVGLHHQLLSSILNFKTENIAYYTKMKIEKAYKELENEYLYK